MRPVPTLVVALVCAPLAPACALKINTTVLRDPPRISAAWPVFESAGGSPADPFIPAGVRLVVLLGGQGPLDQEARRSPQAALLGVITPFGVEVYERWTGIDSDPIDANLPLLGDDDLATAVVRAVGAASGAALRTPPTYGRFDPDARVTGPDEPALDAARAVEASTGTVVVLWPRLEAAHLVRWVDRRRATGVVSWGVEDHTAEELLITARISAWLVSNGSVERRCTARVGGSGPANVPARALLELARRSVLVGLEVTVRNSNCAFAP